MAFTAGFFVVIMKYEHFDSKRNPRAKKFAENHWVIEDDKYLSVGSALIFEIQEAARRNYAINRPTVQSHDSDICLLYVKAFSKAGAAKKSIRYEGEILDHYRPTEAEEKESTRLNRESELLRTKRDVPRWRDIVSKTHDKFPGIDRSKIPEHEPDHPFGEKTKLNKYACALYQCGAIGEKQWSEFIKTLETGHVNGTDEYLVTMVPNQD
ncbi:hypothetical protein [Rhizobium leguminosarum]